jgi:hypothetical protein
VSDAAANTVASVPPPPLADDAAVLPVDAGLAALEGVLLLVDELPHAAMLTASPTATSATAPLIEVTRDLLMRRLGIMPSGSLSAAARRPRVRTFRG